MTVALDSGFLQKDTYWVDDPTDGLSMIENPSGLNGSARWNTTGLNAPNNEHPVLSGHQLHVLRAVAITAATVSVATGLIAGWWFIRMKRSFRHQ